MRPEYLYVLHPNRDITPSILNYRESVPAVYRQVVVISSTKEIFYIPPDIQKKKNKNLYKEGGLSLRYSFNAYTHSCSLSHFMSLYLISGNLLTHYTCRVTTKPLPFSCQFSTFLSVIV